MSNNSLANQSLDAIDKLNDAGSADFVPYDEDLESVPDDKAIRELAQFGAELKTKTRQIEEAEANLAALKKDTAYLAEVTIPDKMMSLGVTSFALSDGTTISLKPEIFVGITKQNERGAYQWLRDNGFGGLIKTQYVMSFDRTEGTLATAAANVLRQNGYGDRLQVEEKIHPATLKAWAKEQDAAQRSLPEELFSVHRINRARAK